MSYHASEICSLEGISAIFNVGTSLVCECIGETFIQTGLLSQIAMPLLRCRLYKSVSMLKIGFGYFVCIPVCM